MERLPLRYFDAGILNVHLARPDRYEVTMGFYGGEITLSEERHHDLEERGLLDKENIRVRFALRQRYNLELALAVFAPDLEELTGENERIKWTCFEISEEEFEGVEDPEFDEWVNVYIRGQWASKPSPIWKLQEKFLTVSALTNVSIGRRLFNVERGDLKRIVYPLTNTTHAYEDAHRELYRYTIDALEKDCLRELNKRLSEPISGLDGMRATTAIEKIFPSLNSTLIPVFKRISDARGNSVHQKRVPPQPFPAYKTFLRDLEELSKGLECLLCLLESLLGLGRNKAKALEMLPPHECTEDNLCEAVLGKKIMDGGHLIVEEDAPKRDALKLVLDDGTEKYIVTTGDVSQFLTTGCTSDLFIGFSVLDRVGKAIVDKQYTEILVLQGALPKAQGKRIRGCRLCPVVEDTEVLPKRSLLFIDFDDGSSLVLEATWNLGTEVRDGRVSADLRNRDKVKLQYNPHWIPAW
ncbi:hypothetical protein [Oceanithermus sp.]|uniref:hypothetical protein n=1 Tax=Oceanithermus sp. TaxID=2268145 RepID=UPI00257E7441|nr:hypothetical protein [Oceanithermus sp.]